MQKSARFVICVRNAGAPASLELRKVYRLVPDAAAASEGLVRVVDESGEDYLYPASSSCRLKCRRQQLERSLSVRPNQALDQTAAYVQRCSSAFDPPLISFPVQPDGMSPESHAPCPCQRTPRWVIFAKKDS